MCDKCEAMYDAYLRHIALKASVGGVAVHPLISDWKEYREWDADLRAGCTDLHSEKLPPAPLTAPIVTLIYKGHPIEFRESPFTASQRASNKARRYRDWKPSNVSVLCASVNKEKVFERTVTNDLGVTNTFYIALAKVQARDISLRWENNDERDWKFKALIRRIALLHQSEQWTIYLLALYDAVVYKPAGVVEAKSISRLGTWNTFEPTMEQWDK